MRDGLRSCACARTPMLVSTSAAPPSLVAQMSSRRSGSETIGDAEHLLDRVELPVARVRVREAVAAVLHLHLREVLAASRRRAPCGGARRGRSRSGSSRRAGGSAASRGRRCARRRRRREEALRRGVGADDERDVAEAGEDLRARHARSPARRSRRRRRSSPPARRSSRAPARSVAPGDVARVAVADRVAAGDELDVASTRARRRRARRAPRPRRTRRSCGPTCPRGACRRRGPRLRRAHRLARSCGAASTSRRRTRCRRPRRACRARAPSPCRPASSSRVDARHDLAEHDHLLALELDRGDRVGLERIGARRRARAARSGCR